MRISILGFAIIALTLSATSGCRSSGSWIPWRSAGKETETTSPLAKAATGYPALPSAGATPGGYPTTNHPTTNAANPYPSGVSAPAGAYPNTAAAGQNNYAGGMAAATTATALGAPGVPPAGPQVGPYGSNAYGGATAATPASYGQGAPAGSYPVANPSSYPSYGNPTPPQANPYASGGTSYPQDGARYDSAGAQPGSYSQGNSSSPYGTANTNPNPSPSGAAPSRYDVVGSRYSEAGTASGAPSNSPPANSYPVTTGNSVPAVAKNPYVTAPPTSTADLRRGYPGSGPPASGSASSPYRPGGTGDYKPTTGYGSMQPAASGPGYRTANATSGSPPAGAGSDDRYQTPAYPQTSPASTSPNSRSGYPY